MGAPNATFTPTAKTVFSIRVTPHAGTVFSSGVTPHAGTVFDATFTDNFLNTMTVYVLNLNGLTSLAGGAGSLAAVSLAGLTTAAMVQFTLPVSVTGYNGNAVLVYNLSASGASQNLPKIVASTSSPGYVWTLGSCSINGQVCALNQTDGLFYPTQAITIGGIVTATIANVGFSLP